MANMRSWVAWTPSANHAYSSRMARKSKKSDEDLDLDSFTEVPDEGLSLDELSGSLANLIKGDGEDPYSAEAESTDDAASVAVVDTVEVDDEMLCPISPLSILEAMLFVGHPSNEPLTNRQVASLMRGVRPTEVDGLVEELNEKYDAEQCVYRVKSAESGYRLELREEWTPIQENFYGKIREAKLSQSAVDVLAIVAYHQPIDRIEVEEVRREPSGRLLAQLVRRQLLRVELTDDKPRRKLHHTTDRFLELFGIASLDELPQSQDFDRR